MGPPSAALGVLFGCARGPFRLRSGSFSAALGVLFGFAFGESRKDPERSRGALSDHESSSEEMFLAGMYAARNPISRTVIHTRRISANW